MQGFPQVLRTWGGALQNLTRGGLSQYMGEHGGLKILSENTCEGVHLIKLPAISPQACKFTKNELLHTFFKDFS